MNLNESPSRYVSDLSARGPQGSCDLSCGGPDREMEIENIVIYIMCLPAGSKWIVVD